MNIVVWLLLVFFGAYCLYLLLSAIILYNVEKIIDDAKIKVIQHHDETAKMIEATKYMIYWTTIQGPHSRECNKLNEALEFTESLRKKAKAGEAVAFITMTGENSNQVGSLGVDSIVNGTDLHCAYARVLFEEIKDLSDDDIKKYKKVKRQAAKSPRFA